jgi:hypothetical protein
MLYNISRSIIGIGGCIADARGCQTTAPGRDEHRPGLV